MNLVRLAESADLDAIHRISKALGYSALDAAVAESNFNAIISSPTDQIWVCQKDDTVLGWIHVFVAYRLASSRFVEIGGIAVDAEYRRIGVGRRLIAQAIQWAQSQKMPLRVRCNTTREDASQFYRSLGFQPIKQQQVFEFI